MAKFRVETQLAIDKASTQAAKQGMEVLTGAAMKLFAIVGGAKLATAPIKAYFGMIEDSIAASEKAAAAQDRIHEAIKSVYKAIGDELTPGMNDLGASIQQALANPEIQKGLQSMGQLLSLVASGIAITVDEIADFVGSPEFSKWLQFIYGVDLNSDVVKKYLERGKAVDQITEAVDKWAKKVREQAKEEEKAAELRKKVHEAHLKNLQSILDRANPLAKAEREAWQQILTLNQALKAGEIDVTAYQDALAMVTAELNAVKAAGDLVAQTIETLPVDRTIQEIPTALLPQQAGAIVSQDQVAQWVRDMDEAGQQIAANLEGNLRGSLSAAIVAFGNGAEDAAEQFGEALKQTLLQAVADYLSTMIVTLAKELAIRLANVAKEAAARKALDAAGGGPMQSMGAGGFSGFGGMSSAAGIAVAAVAVMAGLVAMFKHQSDRANAVRYDTVSGAVATNGAIQSGFQGKLGETGQKVSEAIAGLLNAFQAATGAFILGTATAEVQIRNDKERFRAVVNGVLVGEFASINEAIIAAAKTAFLNADLSATLDPAIQQVIANFQGDDPQKMVDAINAVRQIVDEVSGLTDVEIALRDLPQQTAAMAGQLMGLGVAFDEANRLAGQWQVTQLQNIRDQITGHQQSAAEQMAERQRQAALFNAQVSLMRAETQLKRDEIAVRVEALRASGQMFEGMVTLANAELQTQSLYLQSKADLYEQDTQIQQWYLDTLGQTANASLQMLEAQLAALDAMLANLPELISPGEIHLPNTGSHGGGGSISTGPSEAELAQQHADAVAQFWQDIADGWRSMLPDLQRRIADLNHWYEEQAARAEELGVPLDKLNELYRAQLEMIREDIIDSFGSPMEAARDRAQEIKDRVAAWFESGQEIVNQYLNGEIGSDELYAALERANELWGEFGQAAESTLMNLALYFTDALGDTKESARIRAELAQLEWDFKKMEMELMIRTFAEAGLLDKEAQARWRAFLATLPDDLPDQPPVNQTQSNGTNAADEARNAAEQALREALDRLRGAVESLTQFQKGLSLSAQSPLTTSQQFQEAQRQYMALLAAAQGGDIDAMSQLADAAQTYLELAAEMFGTSGAGYAAIFDAVSQQVAAIAAMGQQILDSVPPQMAGTEERLDTIADILRVMAGIGSGGGTGGGNPHAGLVYYGPDWGWHPMGWSPGGNVPNPATVTTASLGSSGNLALGNFSQPGSAVIVRAPELLAEIRTLTEAHKAATVEAKNDRLKKPTFSTSGVYGRSVGSKRSA